MKYARNHVQQPDTPGSVMRRLAGMACDTALLIITAAVLAAVANTISPAGIPWVRDPSPADDANHKVIALGYESFDLKQAMRVVDEQVFLIFDARHEDSYATGHLPGALPLPREQAQTFLPQYTPLLLPDQPVMVYCSGRSCTDSVEVATMLKDQGIKQVAVFIEGFEAWQDAGLEVQTGE